MKTAFISYVREDAETVKRLARELKRAGIDVWLDRERLLPGQRWQDSIREAIRRGDYFIACFSPSSVSRDRSYMNEELTVAIDELRLRPSDISWFIPIRIAECAIPARAISATETLHSLQWLDLFSNWKGGVRRLADAIVGKRELSPEDFALFTHIEKGAMGVVIKQAKRDGFILVSENDMKEFMLWFCERLPSPELAAKCQQQMLELYRDATDEPADFTLHFDAARQLKEWLKEEILELIELATDHIGQLNMPKGAELQQHAKTISEGSDPLIHYFQYSWAMVEKGVEGKCSGTDWWKALPLLVRRHEITYGLASVIKKMRVILHQVLRSQAVLTKDMSEAIAQYAVIGLFVLVECGPTDGKPNKAVNPSGGTGGF